VEVHLKDLPRSQGRVLRQTAHRMLFKGLGTLLVDSARQQLRNAQPLQALRTMRGLLPFRQDVFLDPSFRGELFQQMLLTPLKRRLQRK
jgi:hypothetical protein